MFVSLWWCCVAVCCIALSDKLLLVRSQPGASVSFGIVQQDLFSACQEMVVVKFKIIFFF